MLELVLLRLNLVNTLHQLHLELPVRVSDLAVLALHVLIDFAHQSLLLVNAQLHALQRVGLIGGHLLLFEFVGGLGLVELVPQILRDKLSILHRLLDLMDLVVVLLAELTDFALKHHHLLSNVILSIAARRT